MSNHFAWYNAPLLCGQCHWLMDCSISRNDFPVEFRAKCNNPQCENYGRVFRARTESAIQLEEITDKVMNEDLAN